MYVTAHRAGSESWSCCNHFTLAGLEDPEDAKISAFGAMGMFLVTLVLSILGIFYDNMFASKGDVEASSEIDAEGYVLNTGDVADYGTKY